MKKKIVVLAVLLIALAGANVFCAGRAVAAADDISFTLETVYGDPSIIDGLEIHGIQAALSDGPGAQDYTIWTSDVKIENGEPVSSTSVRTGLPIDYFGSKSRTEKNYQGYGIRAVFDAGDTYEMRHNELVADLVKDVEIDPQGTPPTVVMLKDLCDLYPYKLDMELPEGFEITEEAFRDFLKIPVHDEQKILLLLNNALTGELYYASYGPEQGEGFALRTFGGMYKGDYLFTFCNKTYQGADIDCSKIPLGYGIYRLSKDGTFSLFRKLDEAETVVYFGVSLDESCMFLHSVRDGKYVVDVLDAETLRTISTIGVRAYDMSEGLQTKVFEGKDSETVAFVHADRSAVPYWNTDRIYLITQDAACDLKIAAADAEKDGIRILSYCPPLYAASASGDRALIASRSCYVHYQDADGGNTIAFEDLMCSVMIHVTGPEGTEYLGILRSSLDDGQKTRKYGLGPYYHPDLQIYSLGPYMYIADMYVLWR